MSQDRPESPGAVRIRSNVCTDPNAYRLVPGDRIPRHQQGYILTREQREEQRYYVPCSLCGKTEFMMFEQGCDNDVCRRQGIPSTVEARRRNSRAPDSDITSEGSHNVSDALRSSPRGGSRD